MNKSNDPSHRELFFLPATLVALLMLVVSASAKSPEQATEVVIEFDAIWRYHDGNVDLGTEWRNPGYDDSGWEAGPALLGYDTNNRRGQWPEPGLKTELEPNLLTYYLRKEFDYQGPLEGVILSIEQIIDDAAVYYLNGEEIGRSDLMPEGEVRFGTSARGVTNPWNDHETIEIEDAPLRRGRNVLAVSVHNQAPGSSDICFGARVSVGEPTVEPVAMYLSWQRDPTTTMTIQWHTEGRSERPAVQYGPLGEETVAVVRATSEPMVFSDRFVHTVEITGLEPDSEYRFRLGNLKEGRHSPFYKFRTMQKTPDRPIRIAIGGDVRHRADWMAQVNRQAMRFDPDFIVWGGDLAYSDGRPNLVYREYEFFQVMMETLITEDGRVVPVLMAIGNHEIAGHFYWGDERGRDSYEDSDDYRNRIAPYFYNLHAFPGHPGYGVLDFGNYMSLIFLDTDHSGPVEGTQTEWLKQTLEARKGVPHLFPVYHVPAYPSVRNPNDGTSRRIREHWHPLFEEAGVRLAFENHDHAYKRTVPIRQGQVDEDGIVYIGDGAWGVGERAVRDTADTWYLERAQSIRHLILLTIQDDFQDLKMISREGDLIDHYIPRAISRERADSRR